MLARKLTFKSSYWWQLIVVIYEGWRFEHLATKASVNSAPAPLEGCKRDLNCGLGWTLEGCKGDLILKVVLSLGTAGWVELIGCSSYSENCFRIIICHLRIIAGVHFSNKSEVNVIQSRKDDIANVFAAPMRIWISVWVSLNWRGCRMLRNAEGTTAIWTSELSNEHLNIQTFELSHVAKCRRHASHLKTSHTDTERCELLFSNTS